MIYFLHIDSGELAGATKIGTSLTPGRRSVDIAHSLQCEVTLHAVMIGGRVQERLAHSALASHRVKFGSHREFFARAAAVDYAAQFGATVVDFAYGCRGGERRRVMNRVELAPRPAACIASRSSIALDQWCSEDRGRAARVALVLGVQESTVSRWRAGTSTPGGPARLALPQVTGGAVPLDGWDGATEAAT